MELKNKVAIITGAQQGIGFGIAKAFAKAGAKVVVCDLDEKKAQSAANKIKKAGGKAIAIACDVTMQDQVQNLIAETVKKYKRLDILVNNAGIYPFKPFTQMDQADWERVMAVNLTGTFLCSRAAVKKMKAGSKIVNISSIASLIGFEGLTHYCASKGGVNAFTRALGLELAPKKINVNAIAPGAIETPGASAGMTKEVKAQTVAGIPLARMGKPDDIAQAAVFLASDGAGYITGQVLTVDGGWTLR